MCQNEAPVRRRKGIRLPKLSLEKDIRYRGPFSYQHFQIFGWICIVLTFVVLMMKTACEINAEMQPSLTRWMDILPYVVDLSMPFLLIANFAIIQNSVNGYRQQLLKNGGAMLGITLVFLLFFNKYFLGFFRAISEAPEEAAAAVSAMIRSGSQNGFMAFNIFVDLFLCTAFAFFLNYKPQRIFKGKARFVFRLFALLPIAYEGVCIYFKVMSSLGKTEIPVNLYPLLTVKPPMTFALFVIMAFFIKTRELRFRRREGTYEEYQLFLQTKRNSLHFSVFSAIAMLIAGIIDLLIFIYCAETMSGGDYDQFIKVANALAAAGFGNSIMLSLLAPFMLLFSYTRKPKMPTLSILIPVFGIVLIFMVFVQGFYQIILTKNLPKLNITELSTSFQEMFEAIRSN